MIKNMRRLTGLLLLALYFFPVFSSVAEPSHNTGGCDHHLDNKQAFFGDLHIHTALSSDAMLFGTVNRPDDAYRFGRGEPLTLKPTIGGGAGVLSQLERPLDFMAVTDHAEYMGAMALCFTPDTEKYDDEICRSVRQPVQGSSLDDVVKKIISVYGAMTSETLCGVGMRDCVKATQIPWRETQQSAAHWNDPCSFTTFVGYEYSGTPKSTKLHRNIIFRNEKVIEHPLSYNDEPSEIKLWQHLKRQCKSAGNGCDVVSIPHNPNLSNGNMFSLDYGTDDPKEQAEIAALRSEIEPLVEIFQLKGDSECRNGLWNVLGASDEFCNFEKYRDWQGARFDDCESGAGNGALVGKGCVSRMDYVRSTLPVGIAEQQRMGENPFKFGFIGSTDAHDGSVGDTNEALHDGSRRIYTAQEPARQSAGGLAGVWAEENTRESIFKALARRETFATSGTRLQVRLFGGWQYDEKMCGEDNWVKTAYANGVAMGSDLPELSRAEKRDSGEGEKPSPTFLVSAMADPGTINAPGNLLQRVQIIKVWPGEGSQVHQAVFDVAGGDTNASVDLNSCQPKGQGATTLCGFWRDPNFDKTLGAAYYARAIENPSCRHTQYACTNKAIKAENKPAFCDDESVAKVIQERAWSSPIWYTP